MTAGHLTPTSENEEPSQGLIKNKSIETVNVQTTACHALVALGFIPVYRIV